MHVMHELRYSWGALQCIHVPKAINTGCSCSSEQLVFIVSHVWHLLCLWPSQQNGQLTLQLYIYNIVQIRGSYQIHKVAMHIDAEVNLSSV